MTARQAAASGKITLTMLAWDGGLEEGPMNPSDAITRARELLEPPKASNGAAAMLAATALAAFAGVLMAGAVMLGPGLEVNGQAATLSAE